MKILVLGASGATGKLVVEQLLDNNIQTRIVIREHAQLPEKSSGNKNLEIVRGNIDNFTAEELRSIMQDCDSAVCCLGHTISPKGMFGNPRRLVVNAVRKVTEAAASLERPTKFVLMSTTAYTNKDEGEKNTFGEAIVFSLLEMALPPHKDNMLAGDLLVHGLKGSARPEWVAVRPDSLIDEQTTSDYVVLSHKARSPIFNAGKVSRVNVAHFIVQLLLSEAVWQQWKYKTPVLYNQD
jgi:nucleoside-diphosphate-sugar epimerase